MKNARVPTIVTFAVLGALAAGVSAHADPIAVSGAPVLDQVFDHPTPTRLNVFGGLGWAQTFTVGIGGELAAVDILVSAVENVTAPLMFDIRQTHGGAPAAGNTDVLASVVVPPSSVSSSIDFLSVDLTGFVIPVTVGDQLAIVLRSFGPLVNGPHYEWGAAGTCPSCGDPSYPGGQLYFRSNDAAAWTRDPSDGAFRSFVRPAVGAAPTPEPATVVLLGVGLAYAGLRQRLKRKAAVVKRRG